MIKQNIKMKVNQEQLRKVQEIYYCNDIHPVVNLMGNEKELYISNNKLFTRAWGIDRALNFDEVDNYQEIDADLFIRTNGTCEEDNSRGDGGSTSYYELPKNATERELIRLGILSTGDCDTRSFNIGKSNYSDHLIQPWSIILDWGLNYWDGDIIKRVLRTKSGESRMLDYQKIIHICEERIRQIEIETTTK